ncbi:Radial spoke head protein 6 A [Fasciola gigantica]|uniref:Radial spoke head protein 6 A n=1 Tax=Fasciola gigantica TaxID=46835 RepID=A0A504YL46_FASGI|nr:Radial spoke head protein 6 A [Fasciola gigantica]
MEEDMEDEDAPDDVDDDEGVNDMDDEDAENARDVLPKNKWKPPPKVPKEPNNQLGVNQKAYYVCHEPGLKWMRLPPVTPQQITAARSFIRMANNFFKATCSLFLFPRIRWNPSKTSGEEMDDALEEEDDENEGGEITKAPPPRPERGPPILTQISYDLPIFGQPAWSVRLGSNLIPEYSPVVVSSNLWPGAHAVAWSKSFENVYIGWGIKASGPGFQPHLPLDPLEEFVETAELTETTDPTPVEEAALRASHGADDLAEEDEIRGDEEGSDAYQGEEGPEED